MTTATHSPVFKRLSKEWVVRAEKRLQRIRDIHDLRFLRYQDYCPLTRDADGYGWVWGYVTRADGDVSYGDLHDADCPDCAEDYLRALSTDNAESGEIYFFAPYTSGSDYSGSIVERSNYKVFEETYGDKEWVFSAYGGYETYATVIGLTGLLTCDDDTFDSICDTLEGLEDYPCIDDEALSKLESEGSDEAWGSWVASDFRREIEKRFDDCAEFNWPEDSDLRESFEKWADEANVYWYNEGYGHDMYIDVGEIVSRITLDDLDKYVVHYTVTYFDCGWVSEDYTIEIEAIERVTSLRASGSFEATYTIG